MVQTLEFECVCVLSWSDCIESCTYNSHIVSEDDLTVSFWNEVKLSLQSSSLFVLILCTQFSLNSGKTHLHSTGAVKLTNIF